MDVNVGYRRASPVKRDCGTDDGRPPQRFAVPEPPDLAPSRRVHRAIVAFRHLAANVFQRLRRHEIVDNEETGLRKDGGTHKNLRCQAALRDGCTQDLIAPHVSIIDSEVAHEAHAFGLQELTNLFTSAGPIVLDGQYANGVFVERKGL